MVQMAYTSNKMRRQGWNGQGEQNHASIFRENQMMTEPMIIDPAVKVCFRSVEANAYGLPYPRAKNMENKEDVHKYNIMHLL